MKCYTADRIHNGFHFEPEGKVLVFDEDDTFLGIKDIDSVISAEITRFEGTLMPGMVNVHCHLELSHTRGLIPEQTGLVHFLGEVVRNRTLNATEKAALVTQAVLSLQSSGCIAVGDIVNGTDTLAVRPVADMHFHTFVETMGFVPGAAAQRFTSSARILEAFEGNSIHKKGYRLRQSMVPHAPYSVSPQLFERINDLDEKSLLSIHNQECAAENEYFNTKTGAMRDLYRALKIDDDWFLPTAKNSLPSYLQYISSGHGLILVHNTCMDASDIEVLRHKKIDVSLCLCPNANLYIEGRLPDVELLADSGLNICLGTDSLASNHQLSIYEEVLQLKRHFPDIGEERLLAWASSAGARALRMDDIIGSFREGTRPGLVWLKDERSKRLL